MEMTGEHRLPIPRETVWEALNDPDVLSRCIPGCESLEKIAENAFNALVAAKVGPVKARFSGTVLLTDIEPPTRYTLTGEGKGGAAGFAKGQASVTLVDDAGGTILSYRVKADVGGKLAQLGGRLINGAAQKMANEFFDNLGASLGPVAAEPVAIADAIKEEAVAAKAGGFAPAVWAVGLIAVVVVLLVIFGV